MVINIFFPKNVPFHEEIISFKNVVCCKLLFSVPGIAEINKYGVL
jgi:hypothetical protein